MSDKNQILKERREAYLREILSEIFSGLHDSRLNCLEIVAVSCSRGKHDAKIFVNKGDFTDKEQSEVLRAFKAARGLIKNEVLHISSWHSAPNFTLEFDSSLEAQNRLDEIFKQIKATK